MEPHLLTVEEFLSNGFVLVGLLFVSVILRSAFNQRHMHWMAVDSVHVRSALQTTVYEKSLRLSTYAISGGEMTMGRITNHMSTDATAMLFLFQWLHHLWAIPIQVVVTLILLYFELGASALIGASVFLIVFPLQMSIAGAVSKIQKDILEFADDRLKHSNELLQGMKLLKLYGWEAIFGDKIEEMRKNEMKQVLKNNTCYSISNFLTLAGPILVTLIAYATYELLNGKPLTPEVTFSSLAFFNLLYAPIYNLPMALAFLANAVVSTRRLQAFLMAPEIDDDTSGNGNEQLQGELECFFSAEVTMEAVSYDDNTPLLYDKPPKMAPGYGAVDQSENKVVQGIETPKTPLGVAVMIKDGVFTWNAESETATLSDINVIIPEGKLTMITGNVGSGKSSLVAAILGEMTTLRGSVQVIQNRLCFAYAAQKAWLINATVRENILFGQSFNPQRYRSVLEACALLPDIDILPAGDKTEIGEKGINLSGGQKQRISVARSLYSHIGLVLLDDPLSALDVHVGSHLFEHGILGMLIKEKRTVILVTHQLQYLRYAAKVIVMKDGRISQQGSFQEVTGQDPELHNQWMDAVSDSDTESLEYKMDASLQQERQQLESLVKSMSMSNDFVTSHGDSEVGKLISAEEMESGSISARVYLYYMNAMGWPLVVLVALSYLTQSGLTLATNFWLSDWSNAGLITNGTTETEYIVGYAALSFTSIAATLVFCVCLLQALFQAANKLHHEMLWNVIAAPMRFFDTTPIGRILNRLSNDTRVIDIKMLESIDNTLYFAIAVLASFVAIAVVTPIFVVLVTPAFIGYYFLQKYYIATSRGLQRLESVTKSPVFAHFSETLGGLVTIRAYKEQVRFNQAILTKVDINNAAYLFLRTANRWLAFRLDLIASGVILIAGIATMISSLEFGVEPSLVGLAIVYALMISNYMNNLVRCATETEIQMNAVERVEYYTNIKREPYSGTRSVGDNWPQKGDISLENISVRYAEDLEPVLNNISLHFNPGEKVGICGRTGSGKSSLSLTLFRLIDTFEGHVFIDGIDISSVQLTTLRQRLAVIPQDPVLFTGTIRWNLDPKGHKPDDELWHSLEIAQLTNIVHSLTKGLDSDITEGGENFSVGERQLFCLARAFLRNSHVLVMDEATASIDTNTEEILQKVVQTAFEDKTVLTIAHRVSTILNCDTIIVMNEGRIMEYGTPETLLADPSSELSALVAANK
ncbi:ATP-binding cassette sub-family C member 9-like [Amphiura filiformis]|uniref:ATP-binding cassette sub-family C member 9-like n=1 Tax=Amphiura filiformis TaxID=82378 RepID=UPI003B21F221